MTFGWLRLPLQSRLGAALGAYALGLVLAGGLAAGGAYQLASMLIGEAPAVRPPPAPAVAALPPRLAAAAPLSPIPQHPATQSLRLGAMQPLQDRWIGVRRPRTGVMPFGTSSRGTWRREREWWEDDEPPRPVSTFRTVCVRLCDGYYFPINFAVTPDRLARDAQACESRCGNQGRLFVQADQTNPRASPEDMVDLTGRSYRELRTAFLYRTEYVPSCKCQPHPWEQASQERHRMYGLAASARKGNKVAAKELQDLKDKARLAPTAPADAPPADRLAQGRTLSPEALMRLGTPPPAPVARPEPSRSGSHGREWSRRAFSAPNH